jgi:hypothetical protein
MCVRMKPYGMDRLMAADVDVSGCAHGGRATRVYNKPHAYHSLRKGKKAAIRRRVKRAARRKGKLACRVD